MRLIVEVAIMMKVYQRIRNLEFQYPRFSTVSESCRSLIAGMLVVDPAKRMTLQEVMVSPSGPMSPQCDSIS